MFELKNVDIKKNLYWQKKSWNLEKKITQLYNENYSNDWIQQQATSGNTGNPLIRDQWIFQISTGKIERVAEKLRNDRESNREALKTH